MVEGAAILRKDCMDRDTGRPEDLGQGSWREEDSIAHLGEVVVDLLRRPPCQETGLSLLVSNS